jgi:hypothetical protein
MLTPFKMTNHPPANSNTERTPYSRQIPYPDLRKLVDSQTGEYPYYAHWTLADWQQTRIVTGTHSGLLRSWERPLRTVTYTQNGPSNSLRQR